MKKFSGLMLIVLLFTSMFGCTNRKISHNEFMDFADRCRAFEYYQTCSKFTLDVEQTYHYNHNNGFLFETYTMLGSCLCNSEEFASIKEDVQNKFVLEAVATNFPINNIKYDIYLVENKNRLYGEFQEFGFVAFNAEKNIIDFYWFFDQDNDLKIYDEESFSEFFNTYFSWLLQ